MEGEIWWCIKNEASKSKNVLTFEKHGLVRFCQHKIEIYNVFLNI